MRSRMTHSVLSAALTIVLGLIALPGTSEAGDPDGPPPRVLASRRVQLVGVSRTLSAAARVFLGSPERGAQRTSVACTVRNVQVRRFVPDLNR